MNWRVWVAEQLRQYAPLTALVPTSRMFASGSMYGRTDKYPFIIVAIGQDFPGAYPGSQEVDVDIYVHDEPGDFMRIDDVIDQIRLAMMGGANGVVGPVSEQDGVACSLQGESRDQADDGFKTIYRTVTFTLRGLKARV